MSQDSPEPSTSRRWLFPLLVAIVVGLIFTFYKLTPKGLDPVPAQTGPEPADVFEPAKTPEELNIPLSESQKAAKPKKSSSSKSSTSSAASAKPGAEDVQILGENANNLEEFTTLEDSAVAALTLDGMYVGEFSFKDQMCTLEADLRVSYVKASGKPPRGRWEYLVTCNDQIKVSNSGIEALESHMRSAGSGVWLLTNPSRPRNILEFTIGSPEEIDFTIYEMYDGKYHRGGSGQAYNTESRP